MQLARALKHLVIPDRLALRLLAIPLVLAPHIWGAPHLAVAATSAVPAELAAQFAATSLAVQAILWVWHGDWCRLGRGRSRNRTVIERRWFTNVKSMVVLR